MRPWSRALSDGARRLIKQSNFSSELRIDAALGRDRAEGLKPLVETGDAHAVELADPISANVLAPPECVLKSGSFEELESHSSVRAGVLI